MQKMYTIIQTDKGLSITYNLSLETTKREGWELVHDSDEISAHIKDENGKIVGGFPFMSDIIFIDLRETNNGSRLNGLDDLILDTADYKIKDKSLECYFTNRTFLRFENCSYEFNMGDFNSIIICSNDEGQVLTSFQTSPNFNLIINDKTLQS